MYLLKIWWVDSQENMNKLVFQSANSLTHSNFIAKILEI